MGLHRRSILLRCKFQDYATLGESIYGRSYTPGDTTPREYALLKDQTPQEYTPLVDQTPLEYTPPRDQRTLPGSF